MKRVRIIIAFEADLDSVKGPWDSAADWERLAKENFTHPSHYNTTATTLQITEASSVHVEGKGWVAPEFPKVKIVDSED